jgi:Glycosyl transferases group 1
MGQVIANSSLSDSRTLLFSHRNLYEPEVWRAGYRELESVIEEVDAVDVIAPGRTKWSAQRRRGALLAGKYAGLVLNPGTEILRLKRDYDLLFVVCEKPSELLNLNAVEGWREHCKTAICWMTEFYERDMLEYKSVLKMLAGFDHVLFTTVGTHAFKPLLKDKMSFLPAGIDTIRFCPYPDLPHRFIDVLSVGRRAETTHQALLRMAESDGIVYLYDTIKDLSAYNVEEHRRQFSTLAKRSRYFIVNPGKIDRPEETGGQSEFGQRFFEGLAPGAILIGERPRNNKEFDRLFDWPEAVIHVPYGSENIHEVIRELDRDPVRQERMRKQNVAEALAKHDWLHRWEMVLELAGLQPLSQLLKRKQRLEELARSLSGGLSRSNVSVG